ncbi:hypothetical protein T492DRAFT_1145057 [Pavlovales sp. CCMP2436]|nr:hypothetical protein T492DRAFT_1145057 [Pavlovales sp. CCMP2436]
MPTQRQAMPNVAANGSNVATLAASDASYAKKPRSPVNTAAASPTKRRFLIGPLTAAPVEPLAAAKSAMLVKCGIEASATAAAVIKKVEAAMSGRSALQRSRSIAHRLASLRFLAITLSRLLVAVLAASASSPVATAMLALGARSTSGTRARQSGGRAKPLTWPPTACALAAGAITATSSVVSIGMARVIPIRASLRAACACSRLTQTGHEKIRARI